MKLKHVLTGSVMGLSLVTAGVITTSVLPTSSVEAAEYRKIYADVTAQMGLDETCTWKLLENVLM